jgi:MoaA/NifB/PqqE/SkfB family radical SAM enzyme
MNNFLWREFRKERKMKHDQVIRKGSMVEFLRAISNFIINFIPESSWFYRKMALLGLKLTANRRLSTRKRLHFDIPITDHCNLNCKYCATFSPVAEKTFCDVQTVSLDLHKLSEITNGEIEDITLSGGEPLLHPKLIEIIEIARKYFTSGEIIIITNGILLNEQPNEFWDTCRKNRINIRITHYPIKLNFESLKNKAEKENVSLGYWGGGDNNVPIKSMWKRPFDLNGTQDLERSWKYCHEANNCTRVKNGKIYTCVTIYSVMHFNKYFNTNMAVTQDDVLELDNVRNLDEILTFISTPKPFCRYCKRKDITTGLKWDISKKEISEWV